MQCNIDSKGRKIRATSAVILLLSAIIAWWISSPLWLSIVLAIGGLFTGFEALKGWCVLRAFGIKTKY